MKGVWGEVEAGHLLVADFDLRRILPHVEVRLDSQAGLGGGGADQVDDDLMTDEGATPPVHADMGKESVLDRVPLAGAGRQVADRHRQATPIGEALQLN